MSLRTLLAATLGLFVMASSSSCLKKENWAAIGPVGAKPSSRAELEQKRDAALASGDVTQVGEYMRYLWQFDWEYRHFIARVEAGKSPKLPDDLVDFDREKYVQEAIAAWSKLRPTELPSDESRGSIVRADFLATALGWGCRDSERAFGKVLVYVAETQPIESQPPYDDLTLLATECGSVGQQTLLNACRAGADLLSNLEEPQYADLDLDKMWPEPSVRVKYLVNCDLIVDGDWKTADETALLENYSRIANSWFKDHHPEEYAAMLEERRKAAERAAALAAEREAQGYDDDYGGGSSSDSWGSSGGGGGGGSSSGGGGPSGPVIVSVRIRNSCPNTVKLFFGDKPGFGSGRSTSISANQSFSEQMREGAMLWIVDDRGNGISSYSASPNRNSIEISSSCTGFR